MREDKNNLPKVIQLSRRMVEVKRIMDLWEIILWWLPNPINRRYYRLEQGDGSVITVFRDMLRSKLVAHDSSGLTLAFDNKSEMHLEIDAIFWGQEHYKPTTRQIIKSDLFEGREPPFSSSYPIRVSAPAPFPSPG